MDTRTIEAANWWGRSRGETNASWIGNYQKSLKNRHRDVIVDLVKSLGPVTSVLEVGAHCGPNLIRLAMEIPTLTELSGVDINVDAIAAGQRWVDSLKLSERIELAAGRVPDVTSALPDGCVDVVLSCYATAYIAPADLDGVLYEMGRLARRAVILAEPMTEAKLAESHHALSGYSEWAHNYVAASKWIGTWRGSVLRTVPVDPPVDRLSRVLIAEKASPSAASTP